MPQSAHVRFRVSFLCLLACVAFLLSALPSGLLAEARAAAWNDVTPMPKGGRKLPDNVDYSLQSVWMQAQIIRFDANMVERDKIGETLSARGLPLNISPDLGWSGQWLDANVLQIFSKKTLPKATAITYTPKDGSKSLAGTPVIRIKEYLPFPFKVGGNPQLLRYSADGTLQYALSFNNGRVDPDALKKRLTVTAITEKRTEDDTIQVETRVPVLSAVQGGKGQEQDILFTIKPDGLPLLRMELPEGFTSLDGPTGLAQPATFSVRPSSLLSVRSIEADQSDTPPWERSIAIRTSHPVKPDELAKYITLAPQMSFSLSEESPGVYAVKGDFSTRPRVTVTIQKGLQNAERTGLMHRDQTEIVTFDDFTPSLALGEQGSLLSPARGLKVPLTTINVNRVQVTLRELPENSLPLMVMGFYSSYRADLSRVVTTRTADVGGVVNRISERSIDLEQLVGGQKGLFFLTAVDASLPDNIPDDNLNEPSRDANRSLARAKAGQNTEEEYSGADYDSDYDNAGKRKSQKLVVVSDIGLVARLLPDGLTVWANSLATAEALPGVTMRVYSANNILITEGVTDAQGLWVHKRSTPWEAKLRPALILASTPAKAAPRAQEGKGKGGAEASGADNATFLPRSYDDMTYLKLDASLTMDSAFDTSGKPYLTEGYEAFCYTPRGVYRPGETVPFRVLVRDSAMKAPTPFPVAWKVFTSTGRTAGQGVATLSAAGGAAFALDLVPATPTGSYRMEVYLPGQEKEQPLGSTTFSVEDLAPPRIEVTLTPGLPSVSGEDDLQLGIAARYLFGTPAVDAPWEATVQAHPLEFFHPDWKAFTFPPQTSRYKSDQYEERDQTLDDEGKGTLSFSPAKQFGMVAQNVSITVRVKEDGGRMVAKNIVLPYHPSPVLFGYEQPRQELTAGSSFALRVAAVTPDGKPAAVQKLSASVALQEHYYSRSEKGYEEAVEKKRIAASSVALSKGVGTLTFAPAKEGTYIVSLLDEGTNTEQTFTLQVWPGLVGSTPGDAASPLLDRVLLSWGKPRYAPGEEAALTVRSPFAGKLLLVVENNREALRRIVDLTKPEETITFPVTADMGPNAYCSIWVIRPLKPDEAFGAHRAFGLVPLMLDHAAARLDIAVQAPEQVLPKTDLPVSVTLKDDKGAPVAGEVTVALIDEGLLSLTNQKTPNPFAFFSAKRAMLSKAFDRYDELMPLTTKTPISLATGGDDEMAADMADAASPITRKLELLSIVHTTVQADASGKASAVLSLPEYSGKGRLMVVAASPAAVGSKAENVRIARAVTVEATTPRMVAPDDTFIVPVVLYASDTSARTATVTVKTEGPLEVQGTNTFTVKLDAKSPKATIDVPVKAKKEAALGVLTLETAIAGSKEAPFAQRLELPVRPPFSRQAKTGSGVIRGADAQTITIPGGYFAGTQKVRLGFSDTPGISLTAALEYLRDYPHGCLEQTTSTTWPYIGVPALLRSLDADMADAEKYRAALDYGVRRILSMQRADGGFAMWPGERAYGGKPYAWGSAYATHLLVEARNTGLNVVPPDGFRAAIRQLKLYLSSPLRPSRDTGYGLGYELSTRAYIVYVLTLNGEPPLGWMQFLRDQGNTLNTSARIFLAGAYALAEGKPDALKDLGKEPYTDGDYGWSYESPLRNEALRLLMWASVDPFAEEAATFAARLVEAANKGRLQNTQESAMTVLALGRYMEKTSAARKPYTAEAEAVTKQGAHRLGSFSQGQTPAYGTDKLIPQGADAPLPVKVAVKGEQGKAPEGAIYYSWVTTGVPVTPPKPEEKGVRVMRRWLLADEATRMESWKVQKNGTRVPNSPVIQVEQGDRITVTLFIEADKEINSLVLSDILPGGFEIENPNLVAPSDRGDSGSGREENNEEDSGDYGEGNVPESLSQQWATVNDTPPFGAIRLLNGLNGVRAEMRDDRLVLFVNTLPQRSAFTYNLRAVSRGTFLLPPTAAEGMYDADIHSAGLPGAVTVYPRGDLPKTDKDGE